MSLAQLPTFKRLLVPLDGSHLAEAVFPAAQALARQYQAEVVLLHALEAAAPEMVHGERHLTNAEEAEAYLSQAAARLRGAGLHVVTHVHTNRVGNVAQSIVDHVAEEVVDLTILCTHGSGGVRGALFGRIAQQVLQRGACPVLLIPPHEGPTPPAFQAGRILAPLDGKATHEPALPFAASLACAFGSDLYLLTVIPTPGKLSGAQAATGMLLPSAMRAVLDLSIQGAADYLAHVREQCQNVGATVTTEVIRGDAGPVVLDFATRLEIDLIVMASHGRVGLDALRMGSVAAHVAARTRCPLLMAPAEHEIGA